MNGTIFFSLNLFEEAKVTLQFSTFLSTFFRYFSISFANSFSY